MSLVKKFLATVLLATVLGLGAPATFADGVQETPGVTGSQETPGVAGPQETPGALGPQETPGIITTVYVALASTFIA